MRLVSKAALQIQKPVEAVFEGIVNPDMMTKYFISESTGRLESGVDLKWKFPEFPDWYPVTQVSVRADESISFVWDPETVVTICLEKQPDNSTVVTVEEGRKEITEENLNWLVSNAGGWSNFLASLKAYLEYGVELRKGAFEFMRKK